MLWTALTLLFGDPRAILFSRVLAAVSALCPGAPVEASAVITVAAYEDRDPVRAAVLLLAAGAHETCFRTMYQVDGPARSWFQVEPMGKTRKERAEDERRLLVDPLYAARVALGIARKGWSAYACGKRDGCPAAAAELARYEMAATWAFR